VIRNLFINLHFRLFSQTLSGLRKGSVPQILRKATFIYEANYHTTYFAGSRGRTRRTVSTLRGEVTAKHRRYVPAGTDVL
jgi:hypothetical protein